MPATKPKPSAKGASSPSSKEMGRRFRDARRAAGLSQRKLAMVAGCTASAISDLERGETEHISAKIALRIGVETGYAMRYLVLGEGTIWRTNILNTDDEWEVVEIYRALSEKNRQIWASLGKDLLQMEPPSAAEPYRTKVSSPRSKVKRV